MAKNSALHARNKKTGDHEVIKQYEINQVDWGFWFFVDTELDAFKAAYQYRKSPHGCKVEYAKGVGRWMVTVFNELAKETGIAC